MTPARPQRECAFRVPLPVPRELALDWHRRPGVAARLAPPWRSAGPREREAAADTAELRLAAPFAHVGHTQRFHAAGPTCVLEDALAWTPAPWPPARLAGPRTEDALARLFAWRHRVARLDLARLAARGGPSLAIAVSGAGGFIGRALCDYLVTQGHHVRRFVRGRRGRGDEIEWDPEQERLDPGRLTGLDAVINLAGAGIADAPWTPARKRVLLASRVRSTATLARAMARAGGGPRVLVSVSGIGAYGDRADEWLDESSTAGRGFLCDLAREWESAATPAREAGVRVVHARTGIVLSPRGGALAKLAFPFRFGAGGALGDGRAWWSWIGLDDLLDVLLFAAVSPALRGVINAVSPEPIRQGEFARVLGRVLARPALVPAPAFALRLLLGRERADQLLLASQRVRPGALVAAGFRWRETGLEELLRSLYGRLRA